MNKRQSLFSSRLGAITGLLVAFAAGCGGGMDPILGSPAGIAPTITATLPTASTPSVTGVAINSVVTATFSKAMSGATLTTSSSTLACPAGTPVTAAVAYDVQSQTTTLTPDAALPSDTLCTATVTTAAQDTVGLALATDFVWTFLTAAVADTTRPSVILTAPAAGATGVPNNVQITATFSEDMSPATISSTSFSVVNTALGTAVAGTVSYSAAARTATFTPSAPGTLASNTSFTATITSAVTDLASNALAGNTAALPNAGDHVWTFTTAALADTTRPAVILTMPAAGATTVSNNTQITATFSEDMSPETISSTNFNVTNTSLGTAVSGTVSYSVPARTVTFTPSSPGTLADDTLFTATITAAATDLASNGLAGNTAVSPNGGNHVWTFTTAALADATRPTVTLTVPTPGSAGVPNNTQITASFSEDMNPATISNTSFSVTNSALGTAVTGTVSYSVAARTASFTPSAPGTLANNTLFTATITTIATDLASNALAGNTAVLPDAGHHVWIFTTGAAGDSTAPTVTAISPLDTSTGVCLTKAVSATFSEPMDAATISTNFLVTDGGVPVAGSVSYDAVGQVATFVPSDAAGFAASTTFVVTLVSGSAGMKDLAGNPLAVDRVWNFTTGTLPCPSAVNLRTAASFGAFGGGAGVTNQGINTVVNGNLGTTAACTLITGFHDAANGYTETPLNIGAVNGSIYCAPPVPGTATTMAIATQARADAQQAYNDLAAMPPGGDPGAGQLGGLVLPPAVYTSAGGTFDITTGDLTLDAQGDANAVWVFQSSAALTVGLGATPHRVLLVNGAQAKNVFWQVGSAGRIEDGSTMVGTIIAPAGITISTAGQTAQTTLIGRAIGLTASVTLVNTTVVAP